MAWRLQAAVTEATDRLRRTPEFRAFLDVARRIYAAVGVPPTAIMYLQYPMQDGVPPEEG